MGSVTGHKIDYNGEGAMRGQRHIPSKTEPKYSPRGQLVGWKRFSWAKVYCKNGTSPWAITLTEPVPEIFSDQSKAGNSNASGTGSVRVIAQGLSRSYYKLSPFHLTKCPWVSEDAFKAPAQIFSCAQLLLTVFLFTV